MAHCYLLCISSGSAIDRQSNNVSLFSLVEQINVPPRLNPPPRTLIPVEVHAYFQLGMAALNREFELRFVLCADTGLETLSEVFRHRVNSPRFRVRTLGCRIPRWSASTICRSIFGWSTRYFGNASPRRGPSRYRRSSRARR